MKELITTILLLYGEDYLLKYSLNTPSSIHTSVEHKKVIMYGVCIKEIWQLHHICFILKVEGFDSLEKIEDQSILQIRRIKSVIKNIFLFILEYWDFHILVLSRVSLNKVDS